MNRLIPGKTKVKVELFRGVKVGDIVVAGIGLAMLILILISSLPHRFAFCLGVVLVAVMLLVRMDDKPNYLFLMHVIAHFAYRRRYQRSSDDALLMERAKGNEMGTLVERMYPGDGDGKKQRGIKEEK